MTDNSIPFPARGGTDPIPEETRQRSEIMRILQEDLRMDSEHVRRGLEISMRDSENARVLSEQLRLRAEEARVKADQDREHVASYRSIMQELDARLSIQDEIIDDMRRAIREIVRAKP